MSDHEAFIRLLRRYLEGAVPLGHVELFVAGDLQNTLDRRELFDLIAGGTIALEAGDITEEEFQRAVQAAPAYRRLIARER